MQIPEVTLSSMEFLSPLQLIRAEHERQLAIDTELQKLASLRELDPVIAVGDALLKFFVAELPLHHQDEELDLFCMLRVASGPKDRVGQIIEELNRDHAAESYLMRVIVSDLKRSLSGKSLESQAFFFSNLNQFARNQQRHLIWENETVLPLASERLTQTDLEELGQRMAARRHLEYPAS